MSTRHFCYDIEFLEDGQTIDLISIGIVCEDGREYYAINSDADWERIRKDNWLMDNVVRHLPTHSTGQVKPRTQFGSGGFSWGGLDMHDSRVKPKWVIANEVRDFILNVMPMGDRPALWAYYGAYDHVALAQLFGKMIALPDGIPMFTHELMQLIESMPGNWKLPGRSGDEHHALADARWNMKVLQAVWKEQSCPETEPTVT